MFSQAITKGINLFLPHALIWRVKFEISKFFIEVHKDINKKSFVDIRVTAEHHSLAVSSEHY